MSHASYHHLVSVRLAILVLITMYLDSSSYKISRASSIFLTSSCNTKELTSMSREMISRGYLKCNRWVMSHVLNNILVAECSCHTRLRNSRADHYVLRQLELSTEFSP
jgi:hypothetical protein